ncbi:MAG: stage II sporulation protein P [Clostridiales bacterium]|nr:stage II sporulation protein P [Clostridiales bacterium]
MRHYERAKRERVRPGFFGRLLILAFWSLVLFFGIVLVLHYSLDTILPVYHATETTPAPTPNPTPIPAPRVSLRLAGADIIRPSCILIYHTHTREAYVDSPDWRSTDQTKSVVAVGAALAERLRDCYGFTVFHDTTDHEPPSLSTAYTRSEQTLSACLAEYPDILLAIDLHRDSFYVTGEPTTDFALVGDRECARLMFVVGEGEGFTQKPDFVTNLALAESICDYLLAVSPKLARPNRIKAGRYNQHLAPLSLLIEMGHNANSLEQALSSIPYLAEGVARVFYTNHVSSKDAVQTLSLVPQD